MILKEEVGSQGKYEKRMKKRKQERNTPVTNTKKETKIFVDIVFSFDHFFFFFFTSSFTKVSQITCIGLRNIARVKKEKERKIIYISIINKYNKKR